MLSTSSSQAEGAIRDWSVLSKEFLKDEKGNVRAIKAVRLEWHGPKFTEIPGSEFEMPADLVLLAMGFLHHEHKAMLEELGVLCDERGNVKCDAHYQTTAEGIFAAGDMRRGQSLVVWAIREGRQAAYAVDKFLMGSTTLPR